MHVKNIGDRFWAKVDKTGTCWLWTAGRFARGGGRKSYGAFTFGGRTHYAHRVAWVLTFGELPPGVQVLHRCDNERCVRPDHLFCGSHGDNMQDKAAKGRAPRGESSMSAKLTEDAVREIRSVKVRPYGFVPAMARRYGVSLQAVYAVVYGKSWRHVT